MRADELHSNDKAKITTGRKTLPFVDGRSLLVRRYKDISRQIITDQGGDDLAEVRLQLIRRFTGASVLAEQIESRIVAGETVDLDEYTQLISSSVRVAGRLGLSRIPKNVTPSLKDYLADRSNDADDRGEDET